jgi:hypothetical protein
MVRFFHKYKIADPIQTPYFEYIVVTDVRYKEKHFRLASVFCSDDDPISARHKAMEVNSETNNVIEFLCNKEFFGGNPMEFTIEVFCRCVNDEIQIIGAGSDMDLVNLQMEYDTLNLYGFVPETEPRMTIVQPDGMEVTI